MRQCRYLLVLLAALPSALLAEISPSNLPAAAVWYFHVDVAEMQSAPAGKRLYAWLEEEVFNEVRDEIGLDFGKEVRQLTAYAATDHGVVMLAEGDFSQKSRDKMLALATLAGSMETFESKGKTYYFLQEEGGDDDDRDSVDSLDIETLEQASYFSFAVPGKVILTSSETEMKSLLASNGKVTGSKEQDGALLILTADRGLLQAGMHADRFSHDEDDWNSNILRNARQVALMLSDRSGKLAIDAQLVTTEAEMANSLASIVRGLISLQVFSSDLDPELRSVLTSTNVSVEGSSLKISVAMDPDVVIAAISD